jgi:hypothetical protein
MSRVRRRHHRQKTIAEALNATSISADGRISI